MTAGSRIGTGLHVLTGSEVFSPAALGHDRPDATIQRKHGQGANDEGYVQLSSIMYDQTILIKGRLLCLAAACGKSLRSLAPFGSRFFQFEVSMMELFLRFICYCLFDRSCYFAQYFCCTLTRCCQFKLSTSQDHWLFL